MATAPQAVTAPPSAAATPNPNKRKKPPKGRGRGKGNPSKNKKLKLSHEPVRRRRRPSNKFLKLLQKRARDYNSDDDDQQQQHDDDGIADDDDEGLSEEASSSGDESGGRVTRFEQGCRAFRIAFLKIMAKKLPDDPLGPILSAHKKLVAAKLAEEAEGHKPKGEARKEKRMAAEKGHVIPTKHLDNKEKKLIKVATQGVVRLFNAVSKAQNPRRGLNPSRSKDAKALAKERKQTFLAELKKSSNQGQKGQASSSFSKHIGKDEDEPGWAPLRDTYMLGSKLKDWDKIQDSDVANKQTDAPLEDSSDEE